MTGTVAGLVKAMEAAESLQWAPIGLPKNLAGGFTGALRCSGNLPVRHGFSMLLTFFFPLHYFVL